ncbi:hypothetical protein [Nevskia ramosa]|uniref:hypothetical protein n=1 Tax=Nevskia ramosa TaxID=64002 RepID=UPI003D0F0BB3
MTKLIASVLLAFVGGAACCYVLLKQRIDAGQLVFETCNQHADNWNDERAVQSLESAADAVGFIVAWKKRPDAPSSFLVEQYSKMLLERVKPVQARLNNIARPQLKENAELQLRKAQELIAELPLVYAH